MNSFLKTLFPCLPIGNAERGIQFSTEKAGYTTHFEKVNFQGSTYSDKEPKMNSEEAASSIVSALLDADKAGPNGATLDVTIQSLVHQAGGWSEYLAERIFAAVEVVLKAKEPMKGVMQEAYDKACEAATEIEGFAVDHPIATAVFCTVIVLGILVVITPYVVEYLGFCAGFGELGPIEGSWAARWQSMYEGSVPKGSLFSYFQRLGMTWKHV